MIYLVYGIHLLVSIFLILVVLLQQGKGADLSVFGGGSTQTAFGATGATSVLHKLTVTSFVLFIVTTMTIAVMQGGRDGSSVMSTIEQTAEESSSETAGEETAAAAGEVEETVTDSGGASTAGDEANGDTGFGAAAEAENAPAEDPGNGSSD